MLLYSMLAMALETNTQKLNAVFELNRFWGDIENTINYELNFAVKNPDLLFTKSEQGISTTLKIEYKIFSKEKEIYSDVYSKTLALRHEFEASSETKFFADKIAIDKISKDKKDYKIWVKITNVNSKKSAEFKKKFAPFKKNKRISDIEVDYSFFEDPESNYSVFLRGNKACYPNPSHIFKEAVHDSIGVYYNVATPKTNNAIIDEKITILDKNEKEIKKIKNSFYAENPYAERYTNIDINKLEPGFYTIKVNVFNEEFSEENTSYFVVKGSKVGKNRMFADIDDEFDLICYFKSCDRKMWRKLSYDGKKLFLERFWGSSENPETKAAIERINERINYANKKFSTGKIAGWKSHRGRIYIKKGRPDDILKGRADATNYTIKEYEIWKYRTSEQKTYVFVEMIYDGNPEIIYVENDDSERSRYNWKEVLGPNFDENLLN